MLTVIAIAFVVVAWAAITYVGKVRRRSEALTEDGQLGRFSSFASNNTGWGCEA
jgi:uncharacterized membrane protein